jgi:hypothetical protein
MICILKKKVKINFYILLLYPIKGRKTVLDDIFSFLFINMGWG